jgi:hypothetical protein
LFDLIRNLQFAHRDHEMVDVHASACDRSQPAVHLGRPGEQVSPAVRVSGQFNREVTPLGGRVWDQGCLGVVPPRALGEDRPVRLGGVEYQIHDRRPEAVGVLAGFGPLLRRSGDGL